MPEVCCIKGCEKLARSFGICESHMQRIRLKQHVLRGLFKVAHHGLSEQERFYRWVDKGAEDGCWLWTGYVNKNGYGMFSAPKNGRRKTFQAHRKSYEFVNGEIAEGMVIRHKCDVKLCVRPNHLEIGTRAQNTQDNHDRGTIKHHRGEDHGGSKLKAVEVVDIFTTKESTAEVAIRYNISPSTVQQIRKRVTWRHVTDHIKKE